MSGQSPNSFQNLTISPYNPLIAMTRVRRMDEEVSPRIEMVNERVAAGILGLSVWSLRRDRWIGHLGGIPFIKLGLKPKSPVRYLTRDLWRFAEERRRVTKPKHPSPLPVVVVEHAPICAPSQSHAPEPIQQRATPHMLGADHQIKEEPPARENPHPVQPPDDADFEDPFAANRAVRRRSPGGYFG